MTRVGAAGSRGRDEWPDSDHRVAAFYSFGGVTPLTAGDALLVGTNGGCVLEALLDLPDQGIARPGDVERTLSGTTGISWKPAPEGSFLLPITECR